MKTHNIASNTFLEMHDDGMVVLHGTYPFEGSMGQHGVHVEVLTPTARLDELGIPYDNPRKLADVLARGHIEGNVF